MSRYLGLREVDWVETKFFLGFRALDRVVEVLKRGGKIKRLKIDLERKIYSQHHIDVDL